MQLIRPSYTPVEEGYRVSGPEQAVVSFSSQSLEKSLPSVLSCLRKYFLCRRRSTQSDNLLQGNSEKVGKLDIFICCFSKKYLLSSYNGTKSMLVLLIITWVIHVKRQLCNFTVNCWHLSMCFLWRFNFKTHTPWAFLFFNRENKMEICRGTESPQTFSLCLRVCKKCASEVVH